MLDVVHPFDALDRRTRSHSEKLFPAIMDLMHDRREKNSLVTKLVAAIVISVLGCIVGVLGWIGATVWLSALKIAALEANQDSIKSEAMEIKKEAKEMNAALIRIEEVIKRQKGALP